MKPTISDRYRLIVLVIVPLGICYSASAYSAVTKSSYVWSLTSIAGGSIVIMVTSTLLATHFVQRLDGNARHRIDLYTLMLAAIPLAVYLSGFRRVIAEIGVSRLEVSYWFAILFASVGIVFVTLMLLVSFAEALVWILLGAKRFLSELRRE